MDDQDDFYVRRDGQMLGPMTLAAAAAEVEHRGGELIRATVVAGPPERSLQIPEVQARELGS